MKIEHVLFPSVCFKITEPCTAVFKKVATFNIDFASRDGNRTHQNAFRSCDSNFVRKTTEIERIKNFGSQIERTLFPSNYVVSLSVRARNSIVFHSTGAINHITT